MSRVSVGDFRVTLVRAGVYHWDGGTFFGVVPKTLWSKQFTADERNLVPLAFNCYVIRTDEHQILVETGGGDKMDPRARERMNLPPMQRPPRRITEPANLPRFMGRGGVGLTADAGLRRWEGARMAAKNFWLASVLALGFGLSACETLSPMTAP